MGQLGRGGALLNVREGTIVLLCAFTISLLSSGATSAIAVDPLLNTVTAVVRLNDSENSTTNDRRRGADRTDDNNSRAATSPVTLNTATPAPIAAPESAPAVTAEPLEQLPSIDTIEIQPRISGMYRPAVSLAVSPVVLGATNDTIAPLQASNHGWKLFGIAWYWWVIWILVGYNLIRRFIDLKQRPSRMIQ